MKNFKTLAAVAALTLSFTGSAHAANKKTAPKKAAAPSSVVAPLDATQSTFAWEGRKIAGPHHGTIALKEGQLEVKGDKIVGGKAVIDMTSIKDLDLDNATFNGKLVSHLKSGDFFDVEKFPTASILVKKVGEPKAGISEVTADVTIKDVTHEEKFPAKVSVADGKASAEGDLIVDRTVYGVKYNSKKFFSLEKLGDKVIDDKFKVSFKVAAQLPASEAPAATSAK